MNNQANHPSFQWGKMPYQQQKDNIWVSNHFINQYFTDGKSVYLSLSC